MISCINVLQLPTQNPVEDDVFRLRLLLITDGISLNRLSFAFKLGNIPFQFEIIQFLTGYILFIWNWNSCLVLAKHIFCFQRRFYHFLMTLSQLKFVLLRGSD